MKFSLLTSSLLQAFLVSFLACAVLDCLTGCIKTTESCFPSPVKPPLLIELSAHSHKPGREAEGEIPPLLRCYNAWWYWEALIPLVFLKS